MTTTQEKIAIMQAHIDGKQIECNNGHAGWIVLQDASPVWNWAHYQYRINTDEPISFDWSVISDDYKFATVNSNGDAAAHTIEPQLTATGLWYGNQQDCDIHHLKSFKRGTVNHANSLIKRPEPYAPPLQQVPNYL